MPNDRVRYPVLIHRKRSKSVQGMAYLTGYLINREIRDPAST